MYYMKSTETAELFEIVAMENLFGQALPYFADFEADPETILQLPHATIRRRSDGVHLLWNSEIATWCFLDDAERRICEAMLEPILYGKLCDRFVWTGRNGDGLVPFLTHLHRRGLLALDGQSGIDPRIYARGPLHHEPFMVELMLTEKCNLGCSYCFAEAEPGKADMTSEIGRLAIDKALALGEQKLIFKFGGGEPLARFNLLLELVQYTMEANGEREMGAAEILFDITTNGTLIDHRVVDALKRYPIRLCISFDGLAEVHDSERYYVDRQRGSHADVEAAIRRLCRGKIPFRVVTVVRKPHLERPRELFEYYERLGIRYTRFNPMIKSGRGGVLDEHHAVTPEDYFTFMSELVRFMGERRTLKDDNVEAMLSNLMFRTRQFKCMRSPCGAGKTFMNVDPQGNIHPCAYYRASTRELDMGNVTSPHLSLDTCHENEPFVERMERRTVHAIPQCSTCTWRHVCTGGCALAAYRKHGKLNAPTELCHYYLRMYPFLLDTMYENPQFVSHLVPASRPVTVNLPPEGSGEDRCEGRSQWKKGGEIHGRNKHQPQVVS